MAEQYHPEQNGGSGVGKGIVSVTSSIAKSTDFEILSHESFLKMLGLERKRSERSRRRFVLMLLRCHKLRVNVNGERMHQRICRTLQDTTRETDIKGWYDPGNTMGVIFTEVGEAPVKIITETLSKKVTLALCEALGSHEIENVSLSFHIYPEEVDLHDSPPPVDTTLYPDVPRNSATRRRGLVLKRALDIGSSLFGLILCSPLFILLASLIKLTSQGPVLFRQQRIGQFGKPFTFLKFRSMYVNSDHAIHKNYVTQFIGANKAAGSGSGGAATYKLSGDPRITRIGKFLRRTSLDELPQLINVLKGDMSLVGPRPPVSYEFAAYEPWHKNRLVAVKPGITGLWQVTGRSRVPFDEMVRLDLRYATSWSLRLDLVILAQTPRAVLTGQGAY